MTNILVIDDSITCRLYYRDVLEAAGFSVAEAINGIDGLERLLQDRFDLVLLDINMPLMDGLAFLRALRSDPNCRAMPVIVISTESAATERDRLYSAGANSYFVKPIDPAALVGSAKAMTGHVSLQLVR
jgi:two-component system chemotaxis response regulator CheY